MLKRIGTLTLLALILVAGATAARAAVETTTVQGTLYLPDGQTVATAGTIRAKISDACSTTDGSGQIRVAGRIEADVGSDGAVDFALVPNDACIPSGTHYLVQIEITAPKRASWNEKWSVTTSPDPVYIGSITRLEYAPGITVGDYVEFLAVEPTGTCTAADRPTFAEDTNKICECVSTSWSCSALGETDTGPVPDCATATDVQTGDGTCVDPATQAELTAHAGTSDAHHTATVDTGPSPDCSGTTTYQDGEGGCDDLSTVYQGLDADLTTLAGPTAWRLFYSNGSGSITELVLGTSGQYLESQGASSAPAWATPGGGGDVTAVGDCTTGDCFASGGTGTELYDPNGNEYVAFGYASSAVNEVTVKNASAGNAPALEATGSDTDIDIELTPKGAGSVVVGGAASLVQGNGTSDLDIDANGQAITLGDGGTTNYWQITDAGVMTPVGSASLKRPEVECFTLYDADGLAAGADLPSVWGAPRAVEVKAIWCEADVGSDITVNANKDDSCDSAALSTSNIENGDLTCGTTRTDGTVVTDGNEDLADGDCLDLEIVSVTSAKRLTVCVEYE